MDIKYKDSATNTPVRKIPLIGTKAGRVPDDNDRRPAERGNHLNIIRSVGLSIQVPFINMCIDDYSCIFYANTHIGVLYEWKSNRQTLLFGHNNDIVYASATKDKKILATCEIGPNNALIVWDCFTGEPYTTSFDIYPTYGIRVLEFFPDDSLLITISATPTQIVACWNWRLSLKDPLMSVELENEVDEQIYLAFNYVNNKQFVSNGKNKVIFYELDYDSFTMDYYSYAVPERTFKRNVGLFSQTEFLYDSPNVFTGTLEGNIIVWGSSQPICAPKKEGVKDSIHSSDRHAIRLMKTRNSSSVLVVKAVENLILIGLSDGEILMYGNDLHLLAWSTSEKSIGPLNTISFPYFSSPRPPNPSKRYQTASIIPRELAVPEFLVGTKEGFVGSFEHDFAIMKSYRSDTYSVFTHPHRRRVFCCIDRTIQMIHYKRWVVEREEIIDEALGPITCGGVDSSGTYIAVGTKEGYLLIFIVPALTHVVTYDHQKVWIDKLAFSNDASFLATQDKGRAITLYRYINPGPIEIKKKVEMTNSWVFIGRQKHHEQAIVDIIFGYSPINNIPILISIGLDRCLVEYDCSRSSKYNLIVLSRVKIDQIAIPTSLSWYPHVDDPKFLIISNTEFKFKFYDLKTKSIVRVILGPIHATPIQRFKIFPTRQISINDEETKEIQSFMMYQTKDGVGLGVLPLDGNPYRFMGMAAHIGGVDSIEYSFEGEYMFSCGASDRTVFAWYINIGVVEKMLEGGGEGMDPFYKLLPGGEDGDLLKDMIDIFYTIQIKNKKHTSHSDTWDISSKISFDDVPIMLKALGFFPTELELKAFMSDIQLTLEENEEEEDSMIDLDTLIKLYLNHKGVFGTSYDEIEWAFEILANGQTELGDPFIDKRSFLAQIVQGDEKMTKQEFGDIVASLLPKQDTRANIGLQVERFMPEELTANSFLTTLLNLPPIKKYTRDEYEDDILE